MLNPRQAPPHLMEMSSQRIGVCLIACRSFCHVVFVTNLTDLIVGRPVGLKDECLFLEVIDVTVGNFIKYCRIN